jgi:hypothetical protein
VKPIEDPDPSPNGRTSDGATEAPFPPGNRRRYNPDGGRHLADRETRLLADAASLAGASEPSGSADDHGLSDFHASDDITRVSESV